MTNHTASTVSCARRRRTTRNTVLVAALALAGCAVDIENTHPALQIAREARTPGSTYVGWRVYTDKCAACHGTDAAGPAKVPGLLDHVREMGARRFVNLVLQRYDWSMPAAEVGGEDAARTALVEEILQRRETAFEMPAWQDEPRVNAHILDLYAYLAARADGAQGAGRPSPQP